MKEFSKSFKVGDFGNEAICSLLSELVVGFFAPILEPKVFVAFDSLRWVVRVVERISYEVPSIHQNAQVTFKFASKIESMK